MTGPGQAWSLRQRLLDANYWPVACKDGKPVVPLWQRPSPGDVRSWGTLEALETGIYDPQTRQVTIVDEVPAAAFGSSKASELRVADRDSRQRTSNQQRKEAARRARGALPRAEWLAAHSAKPWIAAGMSRATYFRRKRLETDMATDPHPGLVHG